jgi:NhaC family Na+:H+ antiporter
MTASLDHRAPARQPTLLDALIPLGVLVLLLALSVKLYGEDSSYGANQVALLLAAAVANLVSLKNGYSWDEIETSMIHGVAMAIKPMFILLAVGSLIGSWIQAGVVPTLVYYGIHLMDPGWFYAAVCLVCAVVGLAIGSSWTVAGTLGVAFMAVAVGLGLSPAITAGAVISGAYFGDKMSPLSDTTNLAPAVAGSELFAHIRHMMWTTMPSIVLALLGFALLGLTASPAEGLLPDQGLADALQAQFHVGWYLLLPVALVMVMAAAKLPAFPTIFIGALVGSLFAVLFQPDVVVASAGEAALSRPMALLSGSWKALATGFESATGNAAVDELLSRGGMVSMLNTIWLIICAMAFGASMEATGLLERVVRGVLALAHSTASLIITTLATSLGVNAVAADQYIAIVLPGRVYRKEYERRGLAPVNLSRALEDAGTLTSPLVPWNTCGAYMAATLGVATVAYLPFALFNLLNPLVAAIMALAGFKVLPAGKQD